MEREGEFIYSLRPRTEKYPNRLLCEVKVVDNTKIVTIRSTYKVENLTLYPLELMIVDDTGHPLYPLQKILPGSEYSLPIEAVTKNKIRLQPDRESLVSCCRTLLTNLQRALGINGRHPFAGKT